MLSCKAKKKNWTVFHEQRIRDKNNELYKPDLIFFKGKAFVLDMTVRYQHSNSSLKDAANEWSRNISNFIDKFKILKMQQQTLNSWAFL